MATPTNSPASSTSNQSISKLWYNYMVWIFVIGLPLFVVVACIWFVFYSVRIQDSTVRDDWYMDGKINIDDLITHVMPITQINEAFDLMHQGESIRSVVTF